MKKRIPAQNHSAIACCPNEDLVVGGTGSESYLLDREGQFKMELIPDNRNDKTVLHVRGVAVSRHGYIMLIDNTKFVKVFASTGKYNHRFTTLSSREDPESVHVSLVCVTTDREGHQVLVGDGMRNVITIHRCPDGELLNRIECSMGLSDNTHMVVNRKQQILIHTTHDDDQSGTTKVTVIDYCGNTLFTFAPKIEDTRDRHLLECGIVCDPYDNIYLALKDYGRNHTGHIHKYSPTGMYLECIYKGLWPADLTMKHNDGSLVVANMGSILIFREGLPSLNIDERIREVGMATEHVLQEARKFHDKLNAIYP